MTGKQKNILLLSITGVLIIGLALFVIFGGRITMNDAFTTGNTAGNLNNGGLFCESGDRVYFANAYDNGALYSMNPDETDLIKLGDNAVSSINAAGNYLYYSMMPRALPMRSSIRTALSMGRFITQVPSMTIICTF